MGEPLGGKWQCLLMKLADLLAALHVSDNYNTVDHFVVVRLKRTNGRWVEDGKTNAEGTEEQAVEQRCS